MDIKTVNGLSSVSVRIHWNHRANLRFQPKNQTLNMSKFIAIAVICSLFLASQAASLQKDTSATIVVSDLNEYLLQNPELVVVAELERSVESKVAIRYTIGRRISGKCCGRL